jgi:hypothetical protein
MKSYTIQTSGYASGLGERREERGERWAQKIPVMLSDI